jgi:hemolysin III
MLPVPSAGGAAKAPGASAPPFGDERSADDIRYRRADNGVHLLGLTAVLAGCVVLALGMAGVQSWWAIVAFGLYGFGLVASFGCSAAYNMSLPGPRRALLRRFDHAAIFLLIAGTYSPVSLLAIGGRLGMALFGVVWIGALLGAALKLAAPARFERVAIAAYLALGWVGIVALPPLIEALPVWQLMALMAGGLLYSLGVIVHVSTRMPYNIAIWHALVLAAAGCHYAVVLGLALG